jgi:hypothetical protein
LCLQIFYHLSLLINYAYADAIHHARPLLPLSETLIAAFLREISIQSEARGGGVAVAADADQIEAFVAPAARHFRHLLPHALLAAPPDRSGMAAVLQGEIHLHFTNCLNHLWLNLHRRALAVLRARLSASVSTIPAKALSALCKVAWRRVVCAEPLLVDLDQFLDAVRAAAPNYVDADLAAELAFDESVRMDNDFHDAGLDARPRDKYYLKEQATKLLPLTALWLRQLEGGLARNNQKRELLLDELEQIDVAEIAAGRRAALPPEPPRPYVSSHQRASRATAARRRRKRLAGIRRTVREAQLRRDLRHLQQNMRGVRLWTLLPVCSVERTRMFGLPSTALRQFLRHLLASEKIPESAATKIKAKLRKERAALRKRLNAASERDLWLDDEFGLLRATPWPDQLPAGVEGPRQQWHPIPKASQGATFAHFMRTDGFGVRLLYERSPSPTEKQLKQKKQTEVPSAGCSLMVLMFVCAVLCSVLARS